jgi:hypothetical protein
VQREIVNNSFMSQNVFAGERTDDLTEKREGERGGERERRRG